ncbi:MAG TPA: PEGA domain-containing protein [Polyangiaceae bacterium]
MRVRSARLTLALLAATGGAHAAPPTTAPRAGAALAPAPVAPPAAESGDARDRARVLFERGSAAYSDKRYFEAIDLFLETQRVYPTPHLAFNIAKAYDHVGNQTGALRYYREYLRGSSDAADAAEVKGRIAALEAALAARGIQQISVLSVPEGATVWLDDQPVGVTPWTGENAPGRYRITLRYPGHTDVTETLELASDHAAELRVELRAEPPKPPAAPARAPAPDMNWPTNHVGTLTWATLAVASGALIGALAVEATSSNGEQGFTRGGAFLTGIGSALAVTGGVLLCFDLCSARAEPRAAVGVGFAPGGAAATFRGSF